MGTVVNERLTDAVVDAYGVIWNQY